MGWGFTRKFIALVHLVEEYEDELYCDFREFYGISLNEIYKQPVNESLALIKGLANKTTSALFVKVNKWKYGMSQESQILADIFDLTVKVNSNKSSKNKPYNRPYSINKTSPLEGTPISVEEAKVRYKKIQAKLHLVKPIN